MGEDGQAVMGNEAGDLDSLASALEYAWLRSNTSGKATTYTTTLKEDFALRAENLYALGLAGINNPCEELYCSDDPIIPMPSQPSVVADMANPRIVEPAGSCSSLVARSYLSFSNLSIPPELSTLLLSAILIDTRCLKMGGKALNSLFVTLGEKKLSVSHSSTRDLLRRDYKEMRRNLPNVIKVGLATVPLRLSAFFASSNWFAERDLSVIGIFTTFRNQKGKGRRERFWIVNADKGITEKVCQGLESGEESEVKMMKKSRVMKRGLGSHVARTYKQGNTSATRKQTAPILQRLMEGL
ncbi:hypothetical protein EDD22DRAFT_978970 [Suillus occidentalis]|nr:hypothetical protein EDD22DRAFT_978970 [Suillus occidentalis]